MNADVEKLEARIAALADRAANFWKLHGLDAEYGGFHGTLSDQGVPVEPTDKGLIQQSRHLWALSTWYRAKEPSDEIRQRADNVYHFLMDHFYDPKSREFVFKVTREGTLVDDRKVLYAQSFAIYGLAEYARAFEQAAAKRAALELFAAIDARAHDSEYGGYLQIDDAPWMPEGSEKETNTHIHLMEAFTTLFEVTQDPKVETRLEELVGIVTGKIFQEAGYAHKDFKRDWTPFGPSVVSYGHDIETFWLVDETARVLGREDDGTLVGPALTMGMNSAERGFDPELGGYFEEGPLGGVPSKVEKIWWIQAEAIPGLFRLYERTGNELWLTRLEKTLDFIEKHQVAKQAGEWYWGILPDGSIGPQGPELGEEWKASYHVLRALVFTEGWMKQWLERRRSGGGHSLSD
jgi:mannobiose 2-epimerase